MSNNNLSREDVEEVAKLARLKLSESELERFTGEIGSVLEYASQVKEFRGSDAEVSGGSKYQEQFLTTANKNIVSDDTVLNGSGEYTKQLLADAPEREQDYIKVSQVLAKHKK